MFFKKRRQKIAQDVKASVATHKERFAAPIKEMKRRFRYNKAQSQAASPQSFAELLLGWNLTEREIPALRRNLVYRVIVFFLIFLVFGSLFLVQGFVISAALIVFPTFLGILTGLWRIAMLDRREYLPFKAWLLGGSKSRPQSGDEEE